MNKKKLYVLIAVIAVCAGFYAFATGAASKYPSADEAREKVSPLQFGIQQFRREYNGKADTEEIVAEEQRLISASVREAMERSGEIFDEKAVDMILDQGYFDGL